MTVTYSGVYFWSSSNNTPSSPPYRVGIEIKSVTENIYDEELNSGIGDGSSYSTLVINDDLITWH